MPLPRRAGLTTVARPARIVALLLVAALGLPTKLAIRQPNGHGEDIREATHQLKRSAHPGDGVLFHCASCHHPNMPREFEFAYPQDFAGLDDLSLATSPSRSNSLRVTDINAVTLASRLANTDRVWLIDVDGTQPQTWPAPNCACERYTGRRHPLVLYSR